MAEDCVDKLEGEVNNLTSMVSEQQKMMKEIQGMLAAMHTRFDNFSSNHSSENSHKRGERERSSVDLARLYEAKSQSQHQQPPFEEKEEPLPPSLSKVSPTTKTIKKLTPTELKERRDKGLCFNCDEKFVPGHQCKKLFFIEVGWPDKHGEGSLEDKG
ncbi:hypothetical protein SO802_000230 [Lithocarpus litseifolius]|uniref:Uncharacterized protein n=1 Tax=Lithocarpus litseifolius TaxID=425828 RepID=A0AAW2DWS4_9ROSI